MVSRRLSIAALLLVALGGLPASCQSGQAAVSGAPAQTAPREPADLSRQAWHGKAVSYSGYRIGHSPTGTLPSREQITEDLRILARHWSLIRLYSADQHSIDALEVIREEKLDLDVMLGIWLEREPGGEKNNAAQIQEGIRMAREYADIVVAVNVGNEILIEWTQHPVKEAAVIRYVRQVKAGVTQPVTVADNYVWWRDFGADLAKEVDFITLHSYPIWERRDIDQGLSYTIENFEGVRKAHPDKALVIGEAGWASYTEGNLHVPRAGDETKQKRYFEELNAWAEKAGVTVFWFEAFDEPWKGTSTEGYWGLFDVHRKAKLAMHETFPELVTDEPTSPTYPDKIETSGPELTSALDPTFVEELDGASINPLGPGVHESGTVPLDSDKKDTALRLMLTGESWAGVYFLLGEYDASKKSAFHIRLRAPTDMARLELKFEGPEARSKSVQLTRFAKPVDASGWTQCVVPLTEFAGLDVSRLTVLGLWNPADKQGAFVDGELLVDGMRFESP